MTPDADWAERKAREVAHSLPPSDFGSYRAIMAFAAALREAVKAERGRASDVVDVFRAGFVSGMLNASREEDPAVRCLVRDFASKAEAQFDTLAAAIRERPL